MESISKAKSTYQNKKRKAVLVIIARYNIICLSNVNIICTFTFISLTDDFVQTSFQFVDI